jgi:DNA invertase Pin-like site-specific DNA recombinase
MGKREGEQPEPVIDIYARISRAVNGETIKTDYQVEVCSEEIAERGARVGKVFVDPSLSAWKRGVIRPHWVDLMGRLESGQADGVMFYDVTRFSRKIIEGERLVEAAERGMRVWSLGGEYDLTTADGRRHFREDMVHAASESDKLSQRIKDGKKRRVRKGKLPSGQRGYGMQRLAPKPDGWNADDPRERVPDEQVAAERAILGEAARRILGGEPAPEVVRDLDQRGVRTVTGERWTRDALVKTLTRPAIAGLAALNGTVVTRMAGVEPIIEPEEWERLCGILAGRPRGRPVADTHILTNSVTCGRCGHLMAGTTRASLPPYPDGSPVRVLRCRRDANHFGCGRNTIDARAAEQMVAVAVKERLGDPRRADRLAARLSVARDERARIDAEITALGASADNLAAKTVTWGIDRVDKAMEPILKKLEKLKADRDALEIPDDPHAAMRDAVREWDEADAASDIAALRAMVRRAFPDLTLTPGTSRGDRSPDRFLWDGPRPPKK